MSYISDIFTDYKRIVLAQRKKLLKNEDLFKTTTAPLIVGQNNINDFFENFETICEKLAEYSESDMRKIDLKSVGLNSSYVITDIHGQLINYAFPLLKIGACNIDKDRPVVYYSQKNRSMYYSLYDIPSTLELNDFTIIPNLIINTDFKGTLDILGDIIDKGANSEECAALQSYLLDQKPKKINFILGNHEYSVAISDLMPSVIEAMDYKGNIEMSKKTIKMQTVPFTDESKYDIKSITLIKKNYRNFYHTQKINLWNQIENGELKLAIYNEEQDLIASHTTIFPEVIYHITKIITTNSEMFFSQQNNFDNIHEFKNRINDIWSKYKNGDIFSKNDKKDLVFFINTFSRTCAHLVLNNKNLFLNEDKNSFIFNTNIVDEYRLMIATIDKITWGKRIPTMKTPENFKQNKSILFVTGHNSIPYDGIIDFNSSVESIIEDNSHTLDSIASHNSHCVLWKYNPKTKVFYSDSISWDDFKKTDFNFKTKEENNITMYTDNFSRKSLSHRNIIKIMQNNSDGVLKNDAMTQKCKKIILNGNNIYEANNRKIVYKNKFAQTVTIKKNLFGRGYTKIITDSKNKKLKELKVKGNGRKTLSSNTPAFRVVENLLKSIFLLDTNAIDANIHSEKIRNEIRTKYLSKLEKIEINGIKLKINSDNLKITNEIFKENFSEAKRTMLLKEMLYSKNGGTINDYSEVLKEIECKKCNTDWIKKYFSTEGILENPNSTKINFDLDELTAENFSNTINFIQSTGENAIFCDSKLKPLTAPILYKKNLFASDLDNLKKKIINNSKVLVLPQSNHSLKQNFVN